MKWLFLLLGLLFALWGSAMAAVNVNTATKEELDSLKGLRRYLGGTAFVPHVAREMIWQKSGPRWVG